MTITQDIRYVGVNDNIIDLFEGMYMVPNGMAYNSYVIMDEKIAVMDTVDEAFAKEWLGKIQEVVGARTPDYLIIQHMEPDHSANILNFMQKYPKATLIASVKAFSMMKNFFGTDFVENRILVADEDKISLGKHKLMFFAAPMVHWPEVIVTYDSTDKVLFSADAFGKFGANFESENEKSENLKDTNKECFKEWIDEARRYYFGIVGKYGLWVQKLLHKVMDYELRMICPLHGPVLKGNITDYIKYYQLWSTYEPEEEGVLIAYTSVYGNTRKAVYLLEEKLKEKGCKTVVVRDLARTDMTKVVAEAFRFSKLVLATTTYNAEIFPPMREFISSLTERNFCNRMVAFVENGSWAIVAAKIMREKLERCKNITFADTTVRITSTLNEENIAELNQLVKELCKKNVPESTND